MSRRSLIAVVAAFFLTAMLGGCEKTPRPKTSIAGAIEDTMPNDAAPMRPVMRAALRLF